MHVWNSPWLFISGRLKAASNFPICHLDNVSHWKYVSKYLWKYVVKYLWLVMSSNPRLCLCSYIYEHEIYWNMIYSNVWYMSGIDFTPCGHGRTPTASKSFRLIGYTSSLEPTAIQTFASCKGRMCWSSWYVDQTSNKNWAPFHFWQMISVTIVTIVFRRLLERVGLGRYMVFMIFQCS